MAMQFHKEIKVSTGEYQNAQGETKKRYTKIGALFIDPKSGGMSAKLDALPIPNADGEIWLKFFDKYDENNQQQPAGFGSQQYAQQPQQAPIPQQPIQTTPPPQQAPQMPQQPQQGDIPF
jgi:hypothetical protein